MAKALFSAKELSEEACEEAAKSLGLDVDRYRRCVANPSTDERIEQLTGWLDRTDVQGLPVIWIGDQRLVGQQTLKSLEAAWARAQRRRQ